MKKSLLILGAIFVSNMVNSQLPVSTTPSNKNVVLEEFTGIHCTYCPDGHKRAKSIKDANPSDVVLINIHTGGYATPSGSDPDFRTSFGSAIAGQTGLTGYPSGTVNRHVFASSKTALSRVDWQTHSTTILGQTSYANVALEGSLNMTTRVLTVDVEAYFTSGSAPTNVRLNLALLQNNVAGPQTGGTNFNPDQINWDGDYIHGHMLRHLITGQWGDTITTTTMGTKFTKTYTYTIPSAINGVNVVLEDLEIAAFIAETNQEIITGAEGPISLILPLGKSLVSLKSKSKSIFPSDICNASFTPQIQIFNTGTVAIDTFDVYYKINSSAPVSMKVTTSLAAGDSVVVVFPSTNLPVGVSTVFYRASIDSVLRYIELEKLDNYDKEKEVVLVSSTAKNSILVRENFEGKAIFKTDPTNCFALDPDGMTFGHVNTSNISGLGHKIGAYGKSDGAYIWDFVITPIGNSAGFMYDKLDFSGNTGSKLDFDYNYAQATASSNDKLEILASKDCGVTWISVFSKAGTALATTSPFGSSLRYFADTQSWVGASIDLSAFDGESSVVIKFIGTSGNGNSLFVDDVRIYDNRSVSLEENIIANTLNIFPNPAHNKVTIEIESESTVNTTITIVDLLGKVVYSKDQNKLVKGTNQFNIDIADLSKGSYFVKINSTNSTVSKKLIVN